LITNEGPNAIKELIDFLKAQKPMAAFTWNEEISMSAQDHASDIGPKGICGHDGSDGSDMTGRIERYGEWESTIGENIDFGSDNADDVIISLMTDDGNASRGHRKNIFNPTFKVTGVGCSNHSQYGHCTVLDYAGGHHKKGPGKAPQGGNVAKNKGGFEELKQEFQNFGNFGGQQGGMNNQQGGFDDDDEPQDAVSTSTQKSTTIVNGKKITKEKKIFKMRDGSTKIIEKEYTLNRPIHWSGFSSSTSNIKNAKNASSEENLFA